MKNMRFFTLTVSIILLLTIAVSAQPFKDEPVSPVSMKEIFPVEKGMEWKYKRDSKEGVSHFTTRFLGTFQKEGEEYFILGNPSGVSYFERKDDVLYHSGIAPAEDLKKVKYYRDGKIIRLKKPLKKGEKWEGSAWLDKNGQSIYTNYKTEILGWEQEEVPAGSYDSVVTSSTINNVFLNEETGFGKGVILHEKAWYAPGTGLIHRQRELMYKGGARVMLHNDELETFEREEE